MVSIVLQSWKFLVQEVENSQRQMSLTWKLYLVVLKVFPQMQSILSRIAFLYYPISYTVLTIYCFDIIFIKKYFFEGKYFFPKSNFYSMYFLI